MKYLDRIADRMLRVRKNHYGHAAVKERNQDARSR